MGEVVTYKNAGAAGVFAQIRLDSGERILLSMAQSGFRVSKLLFGFIPKQTIWEVPQGEILNKLSDHTDPSKHPLDVAIQIVKDRQDIVAVRQALETL